MIFLSPNMPLQIIARILQGGAATIVWVTGLAMIADTVGQEDMGQYVSYTSIAMMVGS